MYLTHEQLEFHEREGFLFLPNVFSPAELDRLKMEAASMFEQDTPNRIVEKEGRNARSVYGAHLTSDVFRTLAYHPRIVKPAEQILDSKVYIYQSKINAKKAFAGDVWEWHQDYVFWLKEDGLPAARVLSAVVFLEDVNEFNGPLYFIPGSHHEGMIEVTVNARSLPDEFVRHEAYRESQSWIASLTADLKYSLDRETVKVLVSKYGIVAPKGPAGSVLFFHCNLVHGSPNNISPFDRVIAIVTFNSIHNFPRAVENPRPEFLVSRDPTPITALTDEALLM
jgi:ectoine hydroxylase